MIPIALYDCLTIEPAAKMVFESNVPELQSNRTNLIIRAVEAFQKLSGNPQDYRIVLEKNIPIGAGLGGGSSNAAATLRLLNRMAGDPISPQALSGVAAELGSDVAFFVEARSAWCTGRGENQAARAAETRRAGGNRVGQSAQRSGTRRFYQISVACGNQTMVPTASRNRDYSHVWIWFDHICCYR